MRTKHSFYISAPLLALVTGACVVACSGGVDSGDIKPTSDASTDAKGNSTFDSSISGDDSTADSSTSGDNDASTTVDSSTGDDDDASTVGDSSVADTGVDSGTCGDGTKNGTEACDLGTAMNNGAYGGCNSDCTLAAYCGDGIKNGTEACDLGDGKNGLMTTCAADCSAVTSLLLHVDASNPSGNGALPADGTAMGAWVDLANGTSVVQSTGTLQPVWKASGIANKPAFLFDGVDDYFDVTLDINGSLRPSITVIAVLQNNTGNNGQYSGVWGQDNGGWDRFLVSGGAAGGNGISNGGGFTVVTGLTAKSTRLVSSTVLVSNTANASKSYVNGVLGATFNGSIQSGGTHMSIGSLQTPPSATGYSMHGYIAELFVYNSALSDTDRTAIETALIAKYTP